MLDESLFSKKSGSARGYSYKCKGCHNAYCRETWYKKNKAKQRASNRKYKSANKIKRVVGLYGITTEEAERLEKIKRCQICNGTNRLAIDHDHATGRVRGKLCMNCNTSLGKLGDNIPGLEKAIAYLSNAVW